jgi:repressor LexA
MKLTKRENEVWNFIARFIVDKGYSPTVREIAKGLSLSSPATVQVHLVNLEKKGYLKRLPGHRGFELTIYPPGLSFKEKEIREVPLVGRVAAGVPTLSLENIEGYFPFPSQVAKEGSFFLKAEGESMIEAGILPGDLLLVRPQEVAQNGEIVVALIDDEVTVKKFRRKKGKVFLEPANLKMKPMEMKRGKIIGKVVAVWRVLE